MYLSQSIPCHTESVYTVQNMKARCSGCIVQVRFCYYRVGQSDTKENMWVPKQRSYHKGCIFKIWELHHSNSKVMIKGKVLDMLDKTIPPPPSTHTRFSHGTYMQQSWLICNGKINGIPWFTITGVHKA